METQDAKQVAALAAEKILNGKDLSQVDALFGADSVDHTAPEGAPTGN